MDTPDRAVIPSLPVVPARRYRRLPGAGSLRVGHNAVASGIPEASVRRQFMIDLNDVALFVQVVKA